MALKLILPEFQQAMNRHTHLTAPLPTMTAWRYGSGQFPDVVYWLMLGPDMLEALAKDARKLTPEQKEQMRALVFTHKPRGRNAKAAPAKKRSK